MQILVVEPWDRIAGIIRNGLPTELCRLTQACSGTDALRFLRTGAVDLVIVNDTPPAVDGMAAVSMIRAAGEEVPVLLLGAPADQGEIVAALDAGVTDYLPRPFAFSELVTRIRALVGGRFPESGERSPEIDHFPSAVSAFVAVSAEKGQGTDWSIHLQPCGMSADSRRLPAENAILALLQSSAHRRNRTIDLPQLQSDCIHQGYSSQEFSYGFVRLLLQQLVVSCGDFVYCLSAEGVRQVPQGDTELREHC